MPDRVRARGAGIRDDLAGRRQAAGFERVDRRLLRRIICDPLRRAGSRVSPAAGVRDNIVRRNSSRRWSSRRRSIRAKSGVCSSNSASAAIIMREARWKAAGAPIVRQDAPQPGIVHLAGGLAAALLDRKTVDRRNAIARLAQGGERRLQPGPERADDPRRHHRHAGPFFLVRVTCCAWSFIRRIASFIPLALTPDLPYIAARNSGSGRWWIVS